MIQNRGTTVPIVIFASGAGTLAESIITFSQTMGSSFHVEAIISNNSGARISAVALQYGIPFYHISGVTHPQHDHYIDALQEVLEKHHARLIILAGYMKLVPHEIVANQNWLILNTHPALLPKYGGKGMYGIHVHKKVIEKMEQISGLTVHRVSEEYDEGEIIHQEYVPVAYNDTPETLEERIKRVERTVYPQVIDEQAKKILT